MGQDWARDLRLPGLSPPDADLAPDADSPPAVGAPAACAASARRLALPPLSKARARTHAWTRSSASFSVRANPCLTTRNSAGAHGGLGTFELSPMKLANIPGPARPLVGVPWRSGPSGRKYGLPDAITFCASAHHPGGRTLRLFSHSSMRNGTAGSIQTRRRALDPAFSEREYHPFDGAVWDSADSKRSYRWSTLDVNPAAASCRISIPSRYWRSVGKTGRRGLWGS